MNGPPNEAATDTAVMAQTATDFKTQADGLVSDLNNLRIRVEEMQAHWIGLGGSAYQNTMAKWAESQRVLNVQLTQTAELIRTAGGSYATAQGASLPELPL